MYKESIKWMFYHWLRVKRFKPKTKRSVEKIADRLSTAHFILTNTKIDDPVMQHRLTENYRGLCSCIVSGGYYNAKSL